MIKAMPIQMTYTAFRTFCAIASKEEFSIFFDNFYIIFTQEDWSRICEADRCNSGPDSFSCSKILRKNWFKWTVSSYDLKNIEHLKKMHEVRPDVMYYCASYLEDLFLANRILGDDRIFTPQELLKYIYFINEKRG